MLASEPVARVLEILADSLQKSNWGWLAQCPSHEDHTASLSFERDERVGSCCTASQAARPRKWCEGWGSR
jgi:hypothetical protein